MGFNMDYDQTGPVMELLDAGVHQATIFSTEPVTGEAGTYLKVRFAITGDKLNRQAWLNLSLSNASLWRVAQIMRDLNLGDGGEEFKSRKAFETAVRERLDGQAVSITIYHEDFEGTTYDRVGKVTTPA